MVQGVSKGTETIEECVTQNILHKISKRKANSIEHILSRNSLLQQVIEGKIKDG
jgi:hypothetical protein